MIRLPYGASDFGEVRKPSPHDICIVKRMIGSDTTSPKDFPILNDAMRIKSAYTIAGIKKNEENMAPRIIEIEVPSTVNGGARYR